MKIWPFRLCLSLCLGCGSAQSSGALTAPPAAPSSDPISGPPAEPVAFEPQRSDLGLDDVNGLSGLTVDGSGTLYTVAETDRFVVAIERPTLALTRYALTGLPDDVDGEAIAWLDGQRFAIGSEANRARTEDAIYLVTLDPTPDAPSVRLERELRLPYQAMGVEAEDNRGIEGICAAEGVIFAGLEPVGEDEGRRFAVLGRYDIHGASWRPFRVWLTTDTGKVSGIDCQGEAGGVKVYAIERHYAVHRIISVFVANGANASDLTPTVERDLAGTLEGDPNLEGLVVEADGYSLIVDNHYGERTGPNELITIATGGAP
ncbi:MAG: esterase-like activity of phytase family protein [Myxococcota bacterium]